MVLIDDKEVKLLNIQKQSLLRRLDRKEITQEEFDEKMAPILEKIKEKTQEFLSTKEKQNEESVDGQETVSGVNEKMSEEKVKSTGRKPVKDSKATYIAKALQMKGVKTFDDVAEKVSEWKEGVDKEKIKKFAKAIIREVKRGKQTRWQKYTWDDENFLLTEKAE